MTIEKKSSIKSICFWAALLGACLIMYWRLVAGWLPVGADISLMFAPFYSLRWDGGPPLWNPYALSGTAFYNNFQTELLYPLRWPFYFTDDWRTYFGLFHFLHHLIALLGMGAFLRALGLGRVSTLAGALLFGAGGHIAGRIINPTIFYACAWLPVLLLGALDSAPRRRWAGTLAFAMILALGSPHLILYGLVGFAVVFFTVPYASFSLTDAGARPEFPPLKKRILWAAFHFMVAFVLISPVFVPGLKRSGESLRTATSIESNLSDSVTFDEIIPIFLGGTGGSVHPEYIDKTCYVGSVALVLILGLFFRRASWRDGRFLCGVALVAAGLVFALGKSIGWQHVMPYVPGFRLLAGPPRAIVLSAAGMGLLGALALEVLAVDHAFRRGLVFLGLGAICLALVVARTWNFPTTEGTAPFFDEWFRAWSVAPACLGRPLYLWMDGGVGLLLAGLFILLFARSRRFLKPALVAVIFFQVFHFYPRVAPPLEKSSHFDAPPQVRFLQERRDAPGAEPFRVAGLDILSFHDGEFNSPHKFERLMPCMATLYGLEDIQGFDPLISKDYGELIDSTSGRPPFNDPIRGVDINRPDLALFDFLGVRYLIGHPYERRLTNMPQTIKPSAPVAEVGAWKDAKEGSAITHWLFVSMVDAPQMLLAGREIARLEVEAEEGSFSFPVRAGMQTEHMRATGGPVGLSMRKISLPIHTEWSVPVAAPRLGYRLKMANYRGAVAFGRPLHVKSVEWHLVDSNALLYVASQGYRLAPPEESEDPWRLAWGAEDEVLPVFEYLKVPKRAVLLGAPEPDLSESVMAYTFAPEDLREDSQRGVAQWVERRTNSLRLWVRASSPSLLVLRERWAPGWKARVNGEGVPVARVNGFLRGVAVGEGESDVELIFRPSLFVWLSVLAGVVLLGLFVWFLRGLKRCAK